MANDQLNSSGPIPDRDDLSQRVLDSLAAEIAVLDKNGTIIAVNRAWKQFAKENGGTPERTGVGVNYFDICGDASDEDSIAGELVSRGIQQVLDGSRDVFQFEYPCHSSDKQRWFLLYVTRVDAAEPLVVTTHLSITERKLTEQRLVVAERLAAIGEAMKGLSHEGRNALQRAQAHIGLLQFQLEDDPSAIELLERIGKAQHHLLELYEEVKNYAAPILLQREPCDLRKLVEQVWTKTESNFTGIRLSTSFHTDDLTCNIDRRAISQVLKQVFKNALESVGNSPEIQVASCADQLEGLPAITLIVSDNGGGVSEEDRQQVFQPFFTTKTRGTGLGLAVCKRIVLEHGGNIYFGSPRRGGASVYITLPVK